MRILRVTVWVVLVVLGALAAVTFLSPARYEVAGIEVETRVVPSWRAGTELALPPFGEVNARTHRVPLKLKVEVKGVDQPQLTEALNHSENGGGYFSLVEKDARTVARRFLLRLIALAGLGGLLASVAASRVWWKAAIAVLISVVVVAFLALGMYLQFDATAFAQPRLTGTLGSAPWVASALEKRLNPIETLREDVQIIARNMKTFASRVEEWQPVVPEKGTTRVLVVSDIHNNPAAFSLITRIVKDFRVDFVVDTGDITDFGTPIEASLLSQLRSFDRPYLYVPGNHDSPAVVSVMEDLPTVSVLDRQTIDINGVLVYGQADPRSRDSRVEPVSNAEMKKLATELERRLNQLPVEPLVVAVHDGRLAERVIGKVPIILRGHTHRAKVEKRAQSTVVDAGTTGATGIRLLQSEEPQKLNFTLSLLYIDPLEKKLIAVDSVEVTALEGDFVLKRNLINGK
jgi:predicted phosphodiesterase